MDSEWKILTLNCGKRKTNVRHIIDRLSPSILALQEAPNNFDIPPNYQVVRHNSERLCFVITKELFPVIFAASNKSSHSIYFKLGDKGMVSITNFHLGHDGKAAQKAIYDGIIENRRHKCLFRVVCGDFNFSSNKFAEASIINGFGVNVKV
jgi:endonuclease/exonuclease/phosphatase family metal-dependent hydrolase